jgi:DNA-binding NarL/FixJ family response regulator
MSFIMACKALQYPMNHFLLADWQPPKRATRLTPRQKSILEAIAEGGSYAEVAATLGHTRNHLTSVMSTIFTELNIKREPGKDRAQEAVRIARELNLMEGTPDDQAIG